MNWKYIIIVIILAVIIGGGTLWWTAQEEVEIPQLPEVKEQKEVTEPEEIIKKEDKQPLEISFQQLLEMNSGDKKNGIEKVEQIDYGFIDTGISERRFIYNSKIYALVSDITRQGMKGGTTVYHLQKIDKDGNKENLRNSLGGIEQWSTGNGTGRVAIGFQGNLYLIMSARTEGGEDDSLVIIKVIGEDDIVKDTLEIKSAKLVYSLGESRGSVLIIEDKLYFKVLEDCSLEEFAKEVCYTGYYFLGENGKFIKSDIFEKEKIDLYR